MKKLLLVQIGVIMLCVCGCSALKTNISTETSNDIQLLENNAVQDNISSISIKIMNSNVNIDTSKDDEYYNLDELTSEFPVEVTIINGDNYDVYIEDTKLDSSSPVEVLFEKIEFDYNYQIRIVDKTTNIESINYLCSMNNESEKFLTMSNGKNDGYYYFTGGGFLYKLNKDGDIVYYKNTHGCSDFKPTEYEDGTMRYTYMQSYVSPLYNAIREGEGPDAVAVIMDEKYNVIKEIGWMSQEGDDSLYKYPLDSHDFVLIDDNHYIMETYLCKHIDNIPNGVEHPLTGSVVSAAIIQEIENDKLMFHWDSTDYPELYASSYEGNDYYNEWIPSADYMHINSIYIDPADNNLIVSFRQQDAVLKLDRETGDIIWTLGGLNDDFNLTREQQFSRQHNAKYTDDGKITLFDNGNEKEQTRVLEFELDEENHIVKSCGIFQIDRLYSPYCGSAQRTSYEDDTFLIGWGIRKTQQPLLSEIDFTTNETLFEVVCVPANEGFICYRAFKYNK